MSSKVKPTNGVPVENQVEVIYGNYLKFLEDSIKPILGAVIKSDRQFENIIEALTQELFAKYHMNVSWIYNTQNRELISDGYKTPTTLCIQEGLVGRVLTLVEAAVDSDKVKSTRDLVHGILWKEYDRSFITPIDILYGYE